MNMNIYHMGRSDSPKSPNFYTDFVIVSSSHVEARKIVNQFVGDSPNRPYKWPVNEKLVTMKIIGKASSSFEKPQIISSSYYGT